MAMQSLPHSERLLDQLRKQLEAGCFCDCSVAIGPSRFRAHRNVLGAFSEYFSSQFQSSADNDTTATLDPEWVNEQVFQKLLDYVYTGYLNVDSDNVEDICKAASFLQMEDVITLCILVQEDIKPICVGTGETSDTSNHKPAPPSQDAYDSFETEEEQEEELVDAGQGGPLPTAQGEEEKRENGEVLAETEQVSRTRVSQRARKPKVMPDGSILKNCTVILQRETRHLLGQPDPRGQPKRLVKSPRSKANRTPHANAEDPDWQAPWSVNDEEDPNEEERSPKRKREQPPKRKRGRPRKSRLKENLSNAPSSDQDRDQDQDQDEDDGQVVYVNGKPVCGICSRVFSESSSVRRHMRIHRGVKPYECQLCNKAFRQGNQLKTHMRTHTGEKPFQCDICDKSFGQKCQVVFHRRMHHGEEKPYKCVSCGLQFATSSNFKIHVRKHSGEKPYGCERCGKHFAQASTLTYHMRRHTGEKPYVCDTCGKAFAVSSSLLAHSRKHTGDTSCFCIVCNKTFASSEELEKHYPCAKAVNKIECDLCEKSYTCAKYLKKHKSKVHNVPDQDQAPLPFPLNIPIDHQSLLSRVPPGPSTAELMTRAKAAADAEAAAAAAEVAAISETVTEFILFQTLD
ncbi:myoneurin-like [Conger conger]|uniref:myoneurin-like n=1 Tax=Conger conger TaxID=82655 RepID=UPI002A5A2203|nr:myoneurin-like [Conger conger]XP_061094853.1 myoneurin-like [Conger conger]